MTANTHMLVLKEPLLALESVSFVKKENTIQISVQ